MKRLISITTLILIANIGLTQNFVMTWNKCYGGTEDDVVNSIIPYNDGYLFFGSTHSTDGDVTNNTCDGDGHGSAWLGNINSNGELSSEKIFCGLSGAYGKKILVDSLGFYLTGSTGPNNYGGINGYWFARTDKNFNIQWQDVLGGSYVEDPRGACIAHDGGVIQYGLTGSPDGDVEEYYGTFDNWLVKMNPDGSRDWIKTLGNVGAEEGSCLIPTSDGNYLYVCVGENFLPGNTYCEGHDNRLSEGWIFKLNEEGDVLWHRCYGGSDIEIFRGILELDNGYIILGSSLSNDIDLPENYGLSDIWILRIDFEGNILWSKNYGGSKWDYFMRIFENEDNTFTIFCLTSSTDYDVQGNDSMGGGTQARVVWMIKIDENGNLIYQKPFSELSFLGGDCDFVKVSEYKYIAAVTRDALNNCYSSPGNQNKDIYIFEIQDMDEFIPSQPIGADEACVENNAKSIYFTQLVVDTMETQWQLIPEEAGEIINLHDSVLISWNQNYFDTVCLQVRAVNEYGKSSFSESKQILLKDCTGLREIHHRQLKVYPNPANTQITFELPIITTESKMQIKDIFGKTVKEVTIFREQTQFVWNCSQISAGVYFYQSEIDGINYSGKILIQ